MMNVRGWKLLVAGLSVTALFAAACSDVQDEPTGGGDTGGGTTTVAQCGSEPINLAVNGWVGAEANAAVAAAVMQQEMGCEVKLEKIDEFPQFPAMQQGEIDASLEVWPSVHPKDRKLYIEDPSGGVVDGGELGVLGNIGWFVPSYVLDEYPEFASYEGIIGNESVFATAETGDKGQFLGSDPAYGFYDEEIAQNLGLDLEFVYSGSEVGSVAALDKAFANKEPLLMYFWAPHWAQAKYDLVEVELPPYDGNAECAAALENADADGYACDYANDVLYKALSAQLEEKDPAAFEFLQNFNWTEEDQNGVAVAICPALTEGICEGGVEPLDAAQEWVDANPTVWEAWLPQAA